VTDAQGNLVKDAGTIHLGDAVSIRLKQGKLTAEVIGHAQD
jgi:ribosomal 50S subunit-recycling heat shock protein